MRTAVETIAVVLDDGHGTPDQEHDAAVVVLDGLRSEGYTVTPTEGYERVQHILRSVAVLHVVSSEVTVDVDGTAVPACSECSTAWPCLTSRLTDGDLTNDPTS